jgi:glycosyltransferase involved in cell wall biosynthesis
MMLSSQPFVSVIMPIRNEADFIAQSLGAVLAQDYPHHQIEILIADGMSDDNTREIIRSMSAKADIEIKIIDNPKQIVPTGFNAALKQAKGDIIVRVDGHCEIVSDYVSQCVAHLLENDIAGVGGPIETISLNQTGETIALAMSSTFGVGDSSFRTVKDREMFVDTIAFPAYKRTVMNHAGNLDEDLVRNQDDEYNYRLRSLGYRLLLTPQIQSKYYARGSIRKLWMQYYQYGFYKVRVMQKHPRQMRPRQFAPLLLVVGIFGGALLASFHEILFGLWILFIALYGIMNLGASVWLASESGWYHLRLLPIVFAALHISYGIGFMSGLVKFWRFWKRGQ